MILFIFENKSEMTIEIYFTIASALFGARSFLLNEFILRSISLLGLAALAYVFWFCDIEYS